MTGTAPECRAVDGAGVVDGAEADGAAGGYAAVVADLRFGRAVAVDGGAVDVAAELAGIDRAGPEVWVEPLTRLLRGASRPVLLGVPSTWGTPRRDVLAAALDTVAADMGPAAPGGAVPFGGAVPPGGAVPSEGTVASRVTMVPRAELIAASHADAAARAVVVAETAIVPDAGPRWSLTRVAVTDDGWRCTDWQVIRLPHDGAAGSPAAGGEEPLWHGADAVFVDGPSDVAEAVALLRRRAGPVRVLAVDGELLRRHGARRWPGERWRLPDMPPVPAHSRRVRRLAAVSLLVAALLVVAVAVGSRTSRGSPAAPGGGAPALAATVGPVAVDVPGSWQRTDRDAGAGGHRAVFTDPGDGRRIIVVVTLLRSGATPGSVAASLRSRIADRGDDAVVEFSGNAEYAGRTVIGYREKPASGSAIRWYVLVDQGVQASIGCQPGTGADTVGAESLDDVCRRAVASAAVTATGPGS